MGASDEKQSVSTVENRRFHSEPPEGRVVSVNGILREQSSPSKFSESKGVFRIPVRVFRIPGHLGLPGLLSGYRHQHNQAI